MSEPAQIKHQPRHDNLKNEHRAVSAAPVDARVRHQIVSFGGGTNSTAMLIEMARRSEQVDAIVFADTGGERPDTYRHVKEFSGWLTARGYPAIETVRNDGIHASLEAECLTNRRLPSAAFGFASCSDKYKRRPFQKWLKRKGLENVTVCIGFDADEPKRATAGAKAKDPYQKRYPLIEWNMGRAACVETIRSAGLELPGKSSCFFCPNMKRHEILKLHAEYPCLLARALEIENNAEADSIVGLGRGWTWRKFIAAHESQADLFSGYPDSYSVMPCVCFDG